MTGMEDVLAAHRVTANGSQMCRCSCDQKWHHHVDYRAHVAQALTAAGFGSLHDAWEDGFSAGQHIARYSHPTAEQWEDLTTNPYQAPKVSET